ncbi:MAG: hypothetical protein V3W09_04180 [Nitrososphaerales archaeon]
MRKFVEGENLGLTEPFEGAVMGKQVSFSVWGACFKCNSDILIRTEAEDSYDEHDIFDSVKTCCTCHNFDRIAKVEYMAFTARMREMREKGDKINVRDQR